MPPNSIRCSTPSFGPIRSGWTELRTDDLFTLDSIAAARVASGGAFAEAGAEKTDTAGLPARPYRKGWFMSDSMSLSKVCWLSTVLPGYGQVYNKQYWKLPILYGTVGTGLALSSTKTAPTGRSNASTTR